MKNSPRPLAVEPVNDIAVLGAPDDQEFGNEADAFLAICDGIEPVPIYRSDLAFGDEFPVQVWTHKGTWVTGTETSFGDQPRWMIVPDQAIEPGTSGGPIINDDGELVGVVSNTNNVQGGEMSLGTFPYAALALPVWVCRQIFGE